MSPEGCGTLVHPAPPSGATWPQNRVIRGRSWPPPLSSGAGLAGDSPDGFGNLCAPRIAHRDRLLALASSPPRGTATKDTPLRPVV